MVEGSTRGRPTSWIAVVVVILGFVIGGLGLIFDNWWVFGIGGAVILAGAAFGAATGIMEDVH